MITPLLLSHCLITVFLATVGLLLAINAQAQDCPSPSYSQDVDPVCLENLRIKLPCYSNPSAYYDCKTGKPVLTTCQSPTYMFSYVLQECSTCANYIPAVECEALKINVTCVDIADVTTSATTLTTAAGGSTASDQTTESTTTVTGSSTTGGSTTEKTTTVKSTTVKSTTVAGDSTTAASTTAASTTTAGPTPPSDGDSTTSGDYYVTGTTILVPAPPSPNEGPTPPGPEPTAPTLPDEPQYE